MMKWLLTPLCVLLWAGRASAQQDAIDLSRAVIHNSPADVASWPATTSITTLNMRPIGDYAEGVSLNFSARSRWPDYTPPGWDGPIQYTIWAGMNINGVWHVAGFMQMWRERVATGAPLLTRVPSCQINGVAATNRTHFACDWAYDGRWGALAGRDPVIGEAMVFFVTAGNARNIGTVTSLRERSNVVMVNLPAGDNGTFTFSDGPSIQLSSIFGGSGDFDGDNRSDITVYRASSGGWFTLLSAVNQVRTTGWGGPGDVPVPADYDGDGRTDVAVFRPTTGAWYVARSTLGMVVWQWGGPGDVPVPGDYDGDGRTDLGVFRQSTATWYGTSPYTGQTVQRQWGASTDVPVPADYDGDGRTDVGVFRPSTGGWQLLLSSTTFSSGPSYQWGAAGDIPVSVDFNGDGRNDIAVFRPSNGGWYAALSGGGTFASTWGGPGDIPVPADYDGDGRTDVAVFRPSTSTWHIWRSAQGYLAAGWGSPTDVPLGKRP